MSASTTARGCIIQSVCDALADINTGDGFHHTVNRVSRTIVPATEALARVRPFLMFDVGPTRFDHEAGSNMEAIIDFEVQAYMNASNPEDMEKAISDMEDDIIVALNADIFRSESAANTIIIEAEGNDSELQQGTKVAALRLLFQVKYFRSSSTKSG